MLRISSWIPGLNTSKIQMMNHRFKTHWAGIHNLETLVLVERSHSLHPTWGKLQPTIPKPRPKSNSKLGKQKLLVKQQQSYTSSPLDTIQRRQLRGKEKSFSLQRYFFERKTPAHPFTFLHQVVIR